MTVWKGGIFYKSAIALAGNTINLTDVFELMEDQNYTVNITFDVVDEKNVKQSSINFGRYSHNILFLFYKSFMQTLMECGQLMSLILMKTLYI